MSFNKFSVLISAVSCTALLLMLFLVYQIVAIQDEIKNSEINRYKSINLAHELFQSSEDLTRLARSYAATGNPIFKEHFYTVVSIRDGSTHRPNNYGPTYWYLNSHPANSETITTPQSLQALMTEAGFTQKELDLLLLSQNRSNQLIQLEEEAFRTIEKELDAQAIEPTVRIKSKAINLLFDKPYQIAKSEIMEPIRLVIDSVEQRTKKDLESLQSRMDSKINQLWFLIISALIFIFLVSAYATNKFVTPLKHLSEIDPLTNLLNRRCFYERAGNIAQRAKPEQVYALMMIDLDNFKTINDTYGHDVGDTVLKHFSMLLKAQLSEMDLIARWGGEEFVVLLPDTTSTISNAIAEQLRKTIETYEITLHTDNTLKFTASIGLVTNCPCNGHINLAIKQADAALYQAKTEGRNKVVSGRFSKG